MKNRKKLNGILVFYRRLAEIAGEYLKKGSQIYVEGKLQTPKWQTKEGQDRYTTEIIVNEMQMLGSKSDRAGSFEVVDNPPPHHQAPLNPASQHRSKGEASTILTTTFLFDEQGLYTRARRKH